MLAGILVSDTSEGAAFFEVGDGFGEAVFAAIEAGSLALPAAFDQSV